MDSDNARHFVSSYCKAVKTNNKHVSIPQPSLVLIVKSKKGNISNKDIEKKVRFKIAFGSNVNSTRLPKDSFFLKYKNIVLLNQLISNLINFIDDKMV